jgi:dTDP-D-glucose 4,6-dehydratase
LYAFLARAKVEDVARAFDVILHQGVTGKIYNVGGTNEKANIEVAKDLVRLMGLGDKEVRVLCVCASFRSLGVRFVCVPGRRGGPLRALVGVRTG